MSSEVGGAIENLRAGPAKVTFKGNACGHTQSGVKFSAIPDMRPRMVDEHGTNVVDMVHQGDKVSVKTTFAEKSMRVIQTVYAFGYSIDENTWGIGETVGGKASDRAGVLLIHPLRGVSTLDDVTLHKAFVSSNSEIELGTVTGDTVFECEFAPLIDESKARGQRIGTIGTSIEIEEE